MSEANTCAHCGLPAPPGPSPAFCCSGCRAVWKLVHETGLEGYYTLRERLADETPGAARATQASQRTSYAYLDDPAVLAELAPGADPGAARGEAQLRCTGLHCAACVWLIEELPRSLDGLERARVDFGTGRLRLEWDPARVRLSTIAEHLHRAGYAVHRIDAGLEESARVDQRRELVRLAVTGASAGNVMLVSFALYAGDFSGMESRWRLFFEFAALILALPAVTYGAWPYYRAAWAGLRARTLHLDLPISLGVLGGFLASVITTFGARADGVYFDSVSVLVFLLLIARMVQQRGQRWALSKTDLLQLLVPPRARRIEADGSRRPCASGSLRSGQHIEVRAGERVPADATWIRGQGSLDTSHLTGESTPREVEVGGEALVLAGSTLLEGLLELEVQAVGADTRAGSLSTAILDADHERAPIHRLVDRVSRFFVAGVLSLALVAGVAWCFVDPAQVFPVVVSLLVVSCPCALGLATPVALAVARAQAARRGILLGSASALEALAKVEVAVFDKTGTLTRGELEVCELLLPDDPEGAPSAEDIRELAGLLVALERDSAHPVGKALHRWARSQGAGAGPGPESILDEVREFPGRGRQARAGAGPERSRLRVGSLAWLGHGPRFGAPLEAALALGRSPVIVELDGQPLALLTLADELRPEAKVALARLRAMGLRLAIRSGDHPAAVAEVARVLDIQDFAGAMSPEAKAASIAELGVPAAMIGDGVNDAPAMRQAGVGVAVRGGAEVALRTADVHLAGESMAQVVELFEGARASMAVIRRNLAFSVVYNCTFAGLAVAGWIDPLMAALLMPASSLSVVLSSTLAHSFPPAGLGTGEGAVLGSGKRAPLQSLQSPTPVPLPKFP